MYGRQALFHTRGIEEEEAEFGARPYLMRGKMERLR
jgi:hypothetical protein